MGDPSDKVNAFFTSATYAWKGQSISFKMIQNLLFYHVPVRSYDIIKYHNLIWYFIWHDIPSHRIAL